MLTTRIALAAPFLVASVAAYGKSIIKNSCASPVYYWEDQGVYGPPLETIQPGKSFTKELYQTGKANGAGPSFKLSCARPSGQMPKIEADAITQFEYTVNAPTWPGKTSFDISNVNGNGDENDPDVIHEPPFVIGGLSISSPQDPSKSMTCPAGQNPCKQGYTGPHDDWATIQTEMENDIVMEICGPNPGAVIPHGSSTGNKEANNSPKGDNKSPPPSPSSSAAPPPPSSSAASLAGPEPTHPPAVEDKVALHPSPSEDTSTQVVWVTEYAPAETVIVHVNGKREEAAPEKRDQHIHNHAHAHNKINKRRHGA